MRHLCVATFLRSSQTLARVRAHDADDLANRSARARRFLARPSRGACRSGRAAATARVFSRARSPSYHATISARARVRFTRRRRPRRASRRSSSVCNWLPSTIVAALAHATVVTTATMAAMAAVAAATRARARTRRHRAICRMKRAHKLDARRRTAGVGLWWPVGWPVCFDTAARGPLL